MNPKSLLLALAFLLLANWPGAYAQEPKEVLQQARAAYDRGDFATAVTQYQSLIAQGLDSAEIFYNLGNAEFKVGHLGLAIASYRRALKRAPQDEDVRYNLNYARTFIRQPVEKVSPLSRLAGNIITLFSGQTLAMTAMIVFWIAAILAGVVLVTRGRIVSLRWLLAFMGVLFICLAAWASLRIVMDRNYQWGVIVANHSEARNGPNQEFQVGFIIPEGREVRVLGHEGDWVAVGLPSEGFKGWIRSSELLEDK